VHGLGPRAVCDDRPTHVNPKRSRSVPRLDTIERRPKDAVSPYDSIAELYDPWSRSVTEDVGFYVDLALASGGPVVELGVGTGRIAIPTARAGVRVIGVDSSRAMLAVCERRGGEAGVTALLDLRLGDVVAPGLVERVPLVTCPFRAYLHLESDAERVHALRAARDLLLPGGRLAFDVFEPAPDDVEETHGRWLEREPGIFERADWDTDARTLTLSVRGENGAATMRLAWLSPAEWHVLLDRAGFEVEALYGWFDRRPYEGGEDSIWVARRRADSAGRSTPRTRPARRAR
jgi:SAM-dependent methyltransferase